jgi:hypothetical protein
MTNELTTSAEIAGLIEEHGYTLLATGEEVIEAALEDLTFDRYWNDPEFKYSREEVQRAIDYLRIKFHVEGKLGVTAQAYYGLMV